MVWSLWGNIYQDPWCLPWPNSSLMLGSIGVSLGEQSSKSVSSSVSRAYLLSNSHTNLGLSNFNSKNIFYRHQIFSLKMQRHMLFQPMDDNLIITHHNVIDIDQQVEASGWWRMLKKDREVNFTSSHAYYWSTMLNLPNQTQRNCFKL